MTMMVVGLVVGAFAAPSVAAEGEAGGTVLEVAAAQTGDQSAPEAGAAQLPAPANQDLDLPGDVTDDPTPFLDDDCPGEGNVDDDILAPGCQNQGTCLENPDQDGCPDITPEPECPDGDQNGDLEGCDPIDEGCPAGQVDNGNGCVEEDDGDDDGNTGATPCLSGKDYNGPNKDGCGKKPGKGNGGTGGTGGTSGSTGGSNGGGLGTTLGVAEGSVPGSEGAAAVTSCSDSVICQSAPAATSTGSSAKGLPETGAAENSRQLIVLGAGLLLAGGGLLLKPGRRGRHRLVVA